MVRLPRAIAFLPPLVKRGDDGCREHAGYHTPSDGELSFRISVASTAVTRPVEVAALISSPGDFFSLAALHHVNVHMTVALGVVRVCVQPVIARGLRVPRSLFGKRRCGAAHQPG